MDKLRPFTVLIITLLIIVVLCLAHFSQQQPLCRDSLDPSKINDDYCDCEMDGSDEPLTSACSFVHVPPGSPIEKSNKFYCVNKGYLGTYIHTSKVHDGICDCCDGSDEPKGKCPSNCYDLGKGLRSELTAKIEAIKSGIKIKNERAAQGKAAYEAKKKELEEHRSSLKAKEEEKKAAIAERERLEKIEEVERNLLREKKQLGKTSANKENKKKKKQEEETTAAAETAENAETNLSSDNNDKNEDDNDDDDEVKNFKTEDAEKARTTVDNLQRDIDTLKTKISDLEKLTDVDYGTDYEYFPVNHKCVNFKQRQYTYEVCLFDKANQKESGSTSLGNFAGWNEDKTVMKFENGMRCWQGPPRSCAVKLQCGMDEEIVAVDEPSRCVYEVIMKTPSACHESTLADLEAELSKLQ